MSNIDSEIIKQRWTHFVEAIALKGKVAYEESDITPEELGNLVRSMSGAKTTRLPWLSVTDRMQVSDRLPYDIHMRKMYALYASFAYALYLRQHEIREWVTAALNLHLDRSSLFTFMLTAKFGIVAADIQPYLRDSMELFEAWVQLHGDDVLDREKAR